MRTLALTDRDVFPPQNGETIPMAAHIRALAELGPVDLACIGFKPERPHAIPENVRWFPIDGAPNNSVMGCVLSGLKGNVPGTVPANPLEMCARLQGRSYDLTYTAQLRLINWARAAKSCLGTAKMVVNMCDSPVEMHRRLLKLVFTSGFDVRFRTRCFVRGVRLPMARQWERSAAELFDLVLVQSENDRATVSGSAGDALGKRILAAPNGVDETVFRCKYQGHDNQQLLHLGALEGERRHLVFWFVRKVYRPLLRIRPKATLHLVGAISNNDRDSLQRVPGIHCHGFVDDLPAVMERATVSIAPMMMRYGVINKVAESMAAGLPVTGLGAFTGFPGFINGTHGIEVRDAAQWVRTLDQLFGDRERLDQLSSDGRSFATGMRWETTMDLIKHRAQALVDPALRLSAA